MAVCLIFSPPALIPSHTSPLSLSNACAPTQARPHTQTHSNTHTPTRTHAHTYARSRGSLVYEATADHSTVVSFNNVCSRAGLVRLEDSFYFIGSAVSYLTFVPLGDLIGMLCRHFNRPFLMVCRFYLARGPRLCPGPGPPYHYRF